MTQKISLTILMIATVLISACNSGKIQTNRDIAEVNILLRNITMDAIKSQDYKQAQRSINALILNEENESDSNWNFIHPALVSLPKDMAYEVLENSLKNPVVSQSSDKMFAIAKVYIVFKDTQKSEFAINESIRLNPRNYDAIYWRARLLTVNKDYDNAEKDFLLITKQKPDNEDYSQQYASFLQETYQYDKAQKILEKLPQNPDNIFKRIAFALQSKNTELAHSLYPLLKQVKVSSDSENNKNYLLGEAAFWLEKENESIEYYQKVEGGDKYLDSREMLSLLYYENEQYDDAVEILHQLQNAEEKYAVKAYRLEAGILEKQGEMRDAIRLLSTSLKILPGNSDLLYDRAMMYEKQGKTQKSIRDFSTIVEKEPEHFQALNALGYTMADHDIDIDKAREYIQKAIELSPDSPAILDSLGWVEFKMGQYEEAEKYLRKALSFDDSDAEIYLHLYHTLMKLDKKESAAKLLSEAKEKFKDNKKLSDLTDADI